MPIMISLAVLALLSTIGWIWGIVAGFRGAPLGLPKHFLFTTGTGDLRVHVRRDLGFSSVFATLCIRLIAWVVFVVNQFSN